MKNIIQITLAGIAILSLLILLGTIGALDVATERGTAAPQYWEIELIISIAFFGGSIKAAELIERSKDNERINSKRISDNKN